MKTFYRGKSSYSYFTQIVPYVDSLHKILASTQCYTFYFILLKQKKDRKKMLTAEIFTQHAERKSLKIISTAINIST